MVPAQNKVSLGTARVVPVFLTLIVAYTSYAITGPLTIQFLLDPPVGAPRRIAVGLAIVIAYYLLLFPVAATWIRLLTVVMRKPGYVPLGIPRKTSESEPAPGLESFWLRDVFVCDPQGLPIWCSHCNAWKPDRVHHNQDTGRCTMKMDHFCPWVGGVVGECSYKFFIQFNFYSFLLSGFTMSVLAYFVAEDLEDSTLQVQWLIALGLAAFFCLFTIGMVGNSLWMTFRNVTTIENIDVNFSTTLIAVQLPPHLQGQQFYGPPPPPPAHMRHETSPSRSGDSDRPLTSEIDDPSHSSYFTTLHAPRAPRRSSTVPYQHRIWKGTVTYPLHLPSDRPPLPAPEPKTFAILETLPGMNPWDMGSALENFKAVFGLHVHDWVLPIKYSPCCDHSSRVSWYPMGPDFTELLIEAGLEPRPTSLPPPKNEHYVSSRSTASRKRRRKRRLSEGWQNGERPDGWVSEKAARRHRRDPRASMQDAPPATRDGLR